MHDNSLKKPAPDRFPWVSVTSEQELHDWLLQHHPQQHAVWLQTYKKAVPDKHVPHEQVLDQLVAFGWADGIKRRVDDERTIQLISPRRTQPWAKSYKDRAERLRAADRMHPAGQSSVDHAKATGAWDAMNDVDALVVPADLDQALRAQPPAAGNFAGFPPSTRRNMLRWIASAKTHVTRTKRIDLTVSEARIGRRVKSNG